jgi:hypothetical protein
MQLGAAMLHVDWLDGRTLGDWQFGVKLLCGRFPQNYQTNVYLYGLYYIFYLNTFYNEPD